MSQHKDLTGADLHVPGAHKTQHENGGTDEISVAGLSGELADDQPPKAHAASKITSGTIDTARLGSGSASSSTYLRGDQTWATVAAGYTDEQAQDAVGAMVDASLTYVDATPLLQRAALTGDVTAAAGSNATTLATTGVSAATYGSATQVAQVALDAKGRATSASNVSIAIAASQVTSGVLAVARLATGTPDGTKFVRDDGTLATPSGSGIAATIVDAKGDIIAATANDAVSRLAVGANDTVLTADSSAGTGLAWRTVGAVSLPAWLAGDPNNAPSSPHADNDEFDSSTLDGDWTVTTAGSATHDVDTTFRSCLQVKLTGSTTDRKTFARTFAPGASTAFSWTAKFHGQTLNANALAALRIRDSGSLNYVLFQITYDSGPRVALHTIDAGSVNLNQQIAVLTVGTWATTLHLERNASNVWEAWVGDMQGMTRIWTATKTWTVSHMELDFFANGSAIKHRMSCDWARRDWVTLA